MNRALIDYLRMFRMITDEEASLILSCFEQKSYKEGEYLFQNDRPCKEMFFICKGVLRIVVRTEKGNEVTHFFLKENQFCTILNSFNNQVSAEESIQAAYDAEVLAITRVNLFSLYEKLPFLKGMIDQITQQALLDKLQIRNSLLGHDSTTRYKLFMMQQPEIALRVSLSDVASYLGITQQSLSRIRKNLR